MTTTAGAAARVASEIRVLLACETGGGRGHVTTLRAVASLIARDATIVAALSRRIFASELTGLCETVLRAPDVLRPTDVPSGQPLRGGATWATALARMGFDDEARVARGLQFWRDLIVYHDISVLVADSAPMALHAARGLREEGWAIRIVSIGTGYLLPPTDLASYPALHADISPTLADEARVLKAINRAGASTDIAPLPRLPALYQADLSLIPTFAFLDPYHDTRPAGDRIAPLVKAPRDGAGKGEEVFVYFSTNELDDPALVTALERLPLPRRGFLPATRPEIKARLAASGMTILDQPASADDIAARSRLVVHAAPHGTVCLSALAGLPQFGVPQHLEQLFNARACTGLGVMDYALPGSADLADRLAAACTDARMADRARALARDLRADHPSDPLAVLADRLAPQLAAARAELT